MNMIMDARVSVWVPALRSYALRLLGADLKQVEGSRAFLLYFTSTELLAVREETHMLESLIGSLKDAAALKCAMAIKAIKDEVEKLDVVDDNHQITARWVVVHAHMTDRDENAKVYEHLCEMQLALALP